MRINQLLVAVTLLLGSFAANAGFVHQDYLSAGDSRITLHEETGLGWMKLSVTVGMSINQVTSEFGTGGKFDGWRLALDSEVEAMLRAAMPTLTFSDNQPLSTTAYSGTSVAQQAMDWVALMGVNSKFAMHYATGIYYQEGTDTVLMSGAAVRVSSLQQITASYVYDDYSVGFSGGDWSNSLYGVYIVKDVGTVNPPSLEDVPVSSAGVLFGFGLMLLSGGVRRKFFAKNNYL